MERVSDVIGYGTFGAALYRYTSVSGDGYMFRMITLDPAGKILAEEQIERWPAPSAPSKLDPLSAPPAP